MVQSRFEPNAEFSPKGSSMGQCWLLKLVVVDLHFTGVGSETALRAWPDLLFLVWENGTGNCTVNDQNHSWRSIRVSFGTGPPDSRSISSVADSSVSWIDCKAAGRLLQLYLCPCLSTLPLWPCSSLYFLLQLEWDLTRAPWQRDHIS